MSSRLGELLQKRGLLTPEQLHKALEYQREHGGALATYLVKLGLVSEDHLLAFIEREYRLPIAECRTCVPLGQRTCTLRTPEEHMPAQKPAPDQGHEGAQKYC